MAKKYIKQIQIGSLIYDLQDAEAQDALANMATNLTWNESTSTFSWVAGGVPYSFTIPEGVAVADQITQNGQDPVKSSVIYSALATKAGLDSSGHVVQQQAPITYLRKITGDPFDGNVTLNIGDAWLDEVNPGEFAIFYKNTSTGNISLGAPSQDLIYCHTDTKKLYKWNGNAMVQIAIPTYNAANYRLIF